MQRHFKFFICTRDRPHMLERCVKNLAYAFNTLSSEAHAVCYIFDDSTDVDVSRSIYRKWNGQQVLNFSIIVIEARLQDNIFRRLSNLAPHHEEALHAFCKTLGQGEWDLAGVRNFAFLYAYACSDEDDLLVFVDDDILFQSSMYHTHAISINGSEVLRTLEASTPPKAVKASGVYYLGRADIAVCEHIQLTMEDMRIAIEQKDADQKQLAALHVLLEDIMLFPQTLPTRLNLPGMQLIERGPGISGAALATTPASLRSHGLMRTYNEDWARATACRPSSIPAYQRLL
ncbi:hypothetical protein KDA_47480 [Dictyobacter alpinus]|uniref:Glycosyl transferase n=1 Tax=Dictyobacter alpinus TaxID=2014873 RepID=A0A402BD52_9CHLR|nr:hypothetical protein [Dictyobacter alpinus]GCE29264.1 hypothetical protein KDA_47480 [Dictyobacter alpinus]